MELILPYLDADRFKLGLQKKYGFEQKEFLNSSFLEMPKDLGNGNLLVFNKNNFYFFRGKWDFTENTIFHSPQKVGDNEMVDFRIHNDGSICSSYINDEKEFEHDTTNIDGLRIFVPKNLFSKDKGLLKNKIEHASLNFIRQEKLKTIFDAPFDDLTSVISLEAKILEYLSYWIQYLLEDDKTSKIKNALTEKILLASNFVEDNIFRDLSINEISRYCGLNNCDLKKGFKNYTHLSIRQYIIKVRMETAKKLIIESDKTIGEICDYIGYSNRGHFSQLYYRYFGKAPSEDKPIY